MVFDEEGEYEFPVGHNMANEGALVEEDRVVDDAEGVAADAPVIREGEGGERKEDNHADGEEGKTHEVASALVEDDTEIEEAKRVALAIAAVFHDEERLGRRRRRGTENENNTLGNEDSVRGSSAASNAAAAAVDEPERVGVSVTVRASMVSGDEWGGREGENNSASEDVSDSTSAVVVEDERAVEEAGRVALAIATVFRSEEERRR